LKRSCFSLDFSAVYYNQISLFISGDVTTR
jgi:hypothetical protein